MTAGEPLGADTLFGLSEDALHLERVDGVEILAAHTWGGLTRFANSAVHQSHWLDDTTITVRVAIDNRVAVAVTNDRTSAGILKAARSAREMADVSAPDPHWPGFTPGGLAIEPKEAFDATTASASPTQRTALIGAVLEHAEPGFRAAGAVETTATEWAIRNSAGCAAYATSSRASVNTVMSGSRGGTGFAESFNQRITDLDADSVGERAFAKARSSEDPVEITAGDFTVVLEPAAVSTLAGFLNYTGFGGRAYVEGRSCLSGKAGQLVAAPIVSITDDAFDLRSIGITFDPEGTPKQRVGLIKDGVFLDAVYDRRTALRADRTSTGHALPPPETEGPFPGNLRFEPGDASVEDMIRATERGILVTRFHYSNVVNAMESIITGMTRDGTFLIENGEITMPVRNLRFTQSILEALTHTTHVGRDLELASEFFFWPSLVPALRIEHFTFSSASDH